MTESRPTRRHTSIVLRIPGGPNSSRWWPPTAEIGNARLRLAWPRMSGMVRSRLRQGEVPPDERRSADVPAGTGHPATGDGVTESPIRRPASASNSTPITAPSPTATASARLVVGTRKAETLHRQADSIAAMAPRTGCKTRPPASANRPPVSALGRARPDCWQLARQASVLARRLPCASWPRTD